MTEYQKWLQSLEAGKQVLISGGVGEKKLYRTTIDRVAQKGEELVLSGGARFYRRDGKSVGFAGMTLVQPTPELLAEIKNGESK